MHNICTCDICLKKEDGRLDIEKIVDDSFFISNNLNFESSLPKLWTCFAGKLICNDCLTLIIDGFCSKLKELLNETKIFSFNDEEDPKFMIINNECLSIVFYDENEDEIIYNHNEFINEIVNRGRVTPYFRFAIKNSNINGILIDRPLIAILYSDQMIDYIKTLFMEIDPDNYEDTYGMKVKDIEALLPLIPENDKLADKLKELLFNIKLL